MGIPLTGRGRGQSPGGGVSGYRAIPQDKSWSRQPTGGSADRSRTRHDHVTFSPSAWLFEMLREFLMSSDEMIMTNHTAANTTGAEDWTQVSSSRSAPPVLSESLRTFKHFNGAQQLYMRLDKRRDVEINSNYVLLRDLQQYNNNKQQQSWFGAAWIKISCFLYSYY